MHKVIFNLCITLFLVHLLQEVQGANNECPLSSQTLICSPKCTTDIECLSSGKKCCPNICNTKSCVLPKTGVSSSGGHKTGSSSATGTYCGNTKCKPGEVCKLDKNTKRMQCGRP